MISFLQLSSCWLQETHKNSLQVETFLTLTAGKSKLLIRTWSFWWPALTLHILRGLPRYASSWQKYAYHPHQLQHSRSLRCPLLKSTKEEQTYFSVITWGNWRLLRWSHSPKVTRPVGGLRNVMCGLWALGIYPSFFRFHVILEGLKEVKNYLSPTPSDWDPDVN